MFSQYLNGHINDSSAHLVLWIDYSNILLSDIRVCHNKNLCIVRFFMQLSDFLELPYRGELRCNAKYQTELQQGLVGCDLACVAIAVASRRSAEHGTSVGSRVVNRLVLTKPVSLSSDARRRLFWRKAIQFFK